MKIKLLSNRKLKPCLNFIKSSVILTFTFFSATSHSQTTDDQVLRLTNTKIEIDPITLIEDFTISTWINFTEGEIINNEDGIVAGNTNDINFWKGLIRIHDASNIGNKDIVIAKTPASTNVWFHYAVVRADGITKIYINGILDATSEITWNNDFTFNNFGTGIKGLTEGTGLNGLMDNLTIWNSARTEEEIISNMNHGMVSQQDLIRLYTFDTNSQEIIDSSKLSGNLALPNNVSLITSNDLLGDKERTLNLIETGIEIEPVTLTEDFTIEAWVNFTEDEVINNEDGIIAGTTNDINFWNSLARIFDQNVTSRDLIIAETASNTNSWNHYAFVREDGLTKLYINGILDNTSPVTWNNDFTFTHIGTGRKGIINETGLNGLLDNLIIWDSARTNEEVINDMHGNIIINEELIRLYTFNGTDTEIVDTTGNSENIAIPAIGASLDSKTNENLPESIPQNLVLDLQNTHVPIDPITLSGDFTVESWVFFTEGQPISNNDAIVSSLTNDLNFFNGNLRLTDLRLGASGNLHNIVISEKNVETGVWAHFAAVREGNESFIYVNGELDANSRIDDWTADYIIESIGGGYITQVNGEGGLDGRLDDLLIWDVARTKEEIYDDMNGDIIANTNLVRSFTFEQSNTTIIDDTGINGNINLPTNTSIVVDNRIPNSFFYNPTEEQRALLTTSEGLDIENLEISGDFTISSWVYFNPDDTISEDDTLANGDTFKINFSNNLVHINVDGLGNDFVVANTPSEVGIWTHYTITRQNGITRLYINGNLDSSSGVLDTIGGAANPTWDSDVVFTDFFKGFNGVIDDLQIWNSARTQSEIQIDLTGNLNQEPNLLQYYTFDGTSNSIVDSVNATNLSLPSSALFTGFTAPFEIPIVINAFTDTQVASGLSLPTDLAFLPDGRLIVIEKSGVVKIFADPTKVASDSGIYIDISELTDNVSERGLLAVEIDPEFEQNGYVYLYHTMFEDDSAHNTVARYIHAENSGGATSTLIEDSRTIIWQEADDATAGTHHGGGLSIGYEPIDDNDPSPYKMYIVTSDESIPVNSADLSHEDGKVHRINLKDGSIPTDNPYYDAEVAALYTPEIDTSSALSTSPENLEIDPQGIITTIHSKGVRNGWRSSYDQESGFLFFGEVGSNINGFEDVHIAVSGANYGWPNEEGFLNDPTDSGNPILSYPHINGPGQDDIPLTGNASITGGVVYRGSIYPDKYVGAYFYGDWGRNWIRYAKLDFSGDLPVVTSDNFFQNTTGRVLSFEQGPDGALYYLTTFQTGGVFTFEGTVNRINFDTNNSPPAGSGIVISEADKNSTNAPHTVNFSADVSDAEGDELSYLWSFGDGEDYDGDGVGDTAISNEENPTYTYNEIGEYVVNLIVTDSNGASTVFPSETIIVGNAPFVAIESPSSGGTYRAGDTITANGFAYDIEDGFIFETENLIWNSSYGTNGLARPGPFEETPDVAGGITFTTPTTGNVESFLDSVTLYLTAIDSDGLSTTESVTLQAETSELFFDLPHEEVQLIVDGHSNPLGDYTFEGVINFEFELQAQTEYQANGLNYVFSHWADDITNTNPIRTIIMPENNTTITPIYIEEISNTSISLFENDQSLYFNTIYPNPSTDGVINIQLGEDFVDQQSLHLTIHDLYSMLHKEKTIIKDSGYFSYTWNTSESGSILKSGTYIFTVLGENNNFYKTQLVIE